MPDATINGVAAYHYALVLANLHMSDATSMQLNRISRGELYVAQDGNYLLRVVLEGRGTSELLTGDGGLEGNLTYVLDFAPLNSNADISIPTGCEAMASSDFPVMPDATNQTIFDGILSYQSPSEMTIIMDFYKDKMPASGWSLIDEVVKDEIGTLRFGLGGRVVSVVITYNVANGLSGVIVGNEPGN